MATKLARHLVSKQKRRFQQDGFDLDLSYITETIIAMGIPEDGLEGKFRNPIEQVIAFFEHYHADKAKIYNLCIESDRQYDPENFSGSTASFPFYDHNCPPLVLIPAFCASAYAWLNGGMDNVVAVHCKAGKSRTGLMLCCLLLHIGEQTDPDECITFYGFQRTRDGKGVTIPSQRRYINYYKALLQTNKALPKPMPQAPMPQPRKMRITGVRLYDVPKRFVQSDKGDKKEGDELQFCVGDHGSMDKKTGINLYESWSEVGGIGGGQEASTVMEETVQTDDAADGKAFSRAIVSLNYNLNVAVDEDFRIFFYVADKEDKRHKLFYTWANTSFMPEPSEPGAPVKYVIYRDQCDKFGQKKKFDKNFRLEVTLEDRDATTGEVIDRAPKPDDVTEQIFREQKKNFDQWVDEDLRAWRLAASSKKQKKKSGGEGGADADEGLSSADLEARAEASERTQTLLTAAQGYTQSIQTMFFDFAENVVLNGRLAIIDAKRDWGTFAATGLTLSSVTMNSEGLVVDRSEGGLRVTIGGISARCEGFHWKFEKVKMPKASDECSADASLGFAIDFFLPVTTENSVFEVGKCEIKVTVEHLALNILGGKHPWVYKRLLGVFEKNVRESFQDLLQDLANSTRGRQELAVRIAAATESANQEIVPPPPRVEAIQEDAPEPEPGPGLEPESDHADLG